jgi:hypothetical protein
MYYFFIILHVYCWVRKPYFCDCLCM